MKKITNQIICLMLAVTLALSLAGCGSNGSAGSAESSSAASTVTVTDHNDNTVTLPADVERIVVTDLYPLPSVLSVFFDSAAKIVGMAPSSMTAAKNSLLSELYPEILDADTSFMSGAEVNTEELMKLNPDVVFYSASNPELGTKLTGAGFNAVALSVNKWNYNAIETLNHWIELLSQIFPNNDRTQKVTDYSNEIYSIVQSRVSTLDESKKAKAFFLFQYDDSTLMTSGKQFFGQWWAEAIGAKNVAEELAQDNSVKVTMEQVYNWNPNLIFVTNFTKAQPDDLYNNTIGSNDWSQIDAVKNQNVHKMPLGMYRSYTPGVDTPITLLWLAKSAYPELFADIDVTAKVIDYYNTVFGITITEEQAESIFAPVSAAGTVTTR